MKLNREFYNRDTLVVAKELLGKILVHEVDGIRTVSKIVEVEAYIGPMDKAAHSYNGRRTPRVEPMYGNPGFAYVYFIYGMYYCFNIVTREEGMPEAVLVRAVEPIEGVEIMAERRFKKSFDELTKAQKKNLTNGPSKLCNALKINKEQNKEDLCGDKLYIEQGKEEEFTIGTSERIGIDYAEEAKNYPWRFYIEGNPYVSKLRRK
ncbi:DNA-3-methyladenine glycosylase [Clostridium ganghwense]|uniref:Putative 3-methyladenine DNA glycosylase n=1 Tax=Clostridium ganghwense TaxID=312089 RepID=A0ABT4CLP5_9CLOT|nr:DNA-3-methyladenine glycosylase [Clostridium ganghwense]MCY6369962.1 DNA-3-methyladenine glycosylase [Clostridium ganghwense]